MSTQRVNQLVEEIQELMEQYHAEVGSRRKPWPRSIKERVRELFVLEVPPKRAAALIAIPYATIMSWKTATKGKRKPNFHSLAVRPSPTVTVRDSDRQNMRRNNLTVTVRTPEGLVLEIPSDIFSIIFTEIQKGV